MANEEKQTKTIQDDIQSKLVELCVYLDKDDRFSNITDKSKLPSAQIVQALAERKKLGVGHHYIRDNIREVLEPGNAEFHNEAFVMVSWLLSYANKNGLTDGDPLKQDIVEAYDKLRTIVQVKSNAHLGMELYAHNITEEKAALEKEHDKIIGDIKTLEVQHTELVLEHSALIAEHDEMAKGLNEYQNIDKIAEEKIKAVTDARNRAEKLAETHKRTAEDLQKKIQELNENAKKTLNYKKLTTLVEEVTKNPESLKDKSEGFQKLYNQIIENAPKGVAPDEVSNLLKEADDRSSKEITRLRNELFQSQNKASGLEEELKKKPVATTDGVSKKELEEIAEKVRKGERKFDSRTHALDTIYKTGHADGLKEKDKKEAEKQAGEYRRGREDSLYQVAEFLGKNKLTEALVLFEKEFENAYSRKAIATVPDRAPAAKPIHNIAGKEDGDLKTLKEIEEDEKDPLAQMLDKEIAAKEPAAPVTNAVGLGHKTYSDATQKTVTHTPRDTSQAPELKGDTSASKPTVAAQEPATSTQINTASTIGPQKKLLKPGVNYSNDSRKKCTPCGKLRPINLDTCPHCRATESTIVNVTTKKGK